MLSGLAQGKVVIALEGGYNLTSISRSMAECAAVLVGDPPPALGPLNAPRQSAVLSVRATIACHHKFWSMLVPTAVVVDDDDDSVEMVTAQLDQLLHIERNYKSPQKKRAAKNIRSIKVSLAG